ncbi:MAG: hypothetical protein DRN49_01760 [Thaumarchaeota archaeon]|nr:MAG: hypothetical protein DRN49_01760 [Nitrososphaerota archaeon]
MAVLFEELVKVLHPEIWSKVYDVKALIVPKRATIGDIITIYVQVKNPGMVAGDKLVELSIDGKTLSQIISLDPGEEKLLNFSFVAEERGRYEVKLGSLLKSIDVSPTSEEIMKEAKESLEESMRNYLNETISPLSSRLNLMAANVSSLKQDFDRLSSNTSSEFLRLLGEISELDERVNSIDNLVVALIILSIIAIIISLASMTYVNLRVKKLRKT